jgi:hypothetical protein
LVEWQLQLSGAYKRRYVAFMVNAVHATNEINEQQADEQAVNEHVLTGKPLDPEVPAHSGQGRENHGRIVPQARKHEHLR